MKRVVLAALVVLFLGFAPIAHAALTNNGGGLIYDTVLNITWYDHLHLYDDWGGSTSWAASLNAGGVTGWTLPTTLPVNGSTYNYNLSYSGSSDFGWNITSPNSEMAYLYYVELGNKGEFALDGSSTTGWFPGQGSTGPFKNLNLNPGVYYWSGTEAPDNNVWFFDFSSGYQWKSWPGNNQVALAVHPGDVLGDGVVLPDGPTTPIPGAILLFGPGLVGLAVIRRRFKK